MHGIETKSDLNREGSNRKMKQKSFRFRNWECAYLDSETPGPVLVFCHANGYSAGCYQYYFNLLSKHYRVIAPDFLGHGRSEFSLKFNNWNVFRDQILALLDFESINKTTIIGHSLGGASSLLAAAKEPSRFEKVLAMDPVILGWKLILLSKFLENPLAKGAKKRRTHFKSIELVRRSFRKFPAFANFEPSIFEDYLNSCFESTGHDSEVKLCCDPKVEARIFGHAHFHVFKNFYGIKTENHIAIPEKFEVCSPKYANLLAKKHPKSDVTIFPGFTHFFPFERQKETWSWMKRCLEIKED
ncbi:alpha/beta hydrolase [Leptospira bourretii]|uniref:Alpha/beta hydrolase n=1 Tax=Leptospira bourretii TaxID=2484962 RepID=A0A4R9IMT0_9LEPT|nr:alpha/beta hydrolase [Leptospira bourretii]TGK86281.1 alpha/beta hydrolase [Leptospira bourretii]TGK92313.1 alpha/beta hydrolase [Leptospira bourretii]TGL26532.1 alpha/beta hydrolase [Leptospira bourretii]